MIEILFYITLGISIFLLSYMILKIPEPNYDSFIFSINNIPQSMLIGSGTTDLDSTTFGTVNYLPSQVSGTITNFSVNTLGVDGIE